MIEFISKCISKSLCLPLKAIVGFTFEAIVSFAFGSYCIKSIPHNADINRLWEVSILKTLWEKEIILLTHCHTMTPFDASGKQAF